MTKVATLIDHPSPAVVPEMRPPSPDIYDPEPGTLTEQRAHRCYELAGKFVLAVPNATLIYGSIAQGFTLNRRWRHAWAEMPDGQIYESTSHEMLTLDYFTHRHRPRVSARFSHDQVVTLRANTCEICAERRLHYLAFRAPRGRAAAEDLGLWRCRCVAAEVAQILGPIGPIGQIPLPFGG